MQITGRWKIIDAELGGKKLPAADFANMVLELDENSYQLIENRVIESGVVELFPDHVPSAMQIHGVYGPNKGKTFQCIYRFEGDDMITCYNLGGDGIPEIFETRENTLLYLVRYRRI